MIGRHPAGVLYNTLIFQVIESTSLLRQWQCSGARGTNAVAVTVSVAPSCQRQAVFKLHPPLPFYYERLAALAAAG